MKNGKLIVLIVIFFVVLIGGNFLYQSFYTKEKNAITQTKEQKDLQKEEETFEAYDFTLNDLNGNSVTLSDYKGKLVVLNFWASWCGYCIEEMPDFQQLYEQEWKDSDEIVFLSVNMTDGQRETEAKARKVVEENGFTFPVLLDVNQEVAYYYGVTSLPITAVIDKEGNLATGIMGMADKETIKGMIDEVKQ